MPPRSPAIFWLLLAATLAVDAVAIYWVNEHFGPTSAGVFYALAFAQISALTIWAILLPPKVQLRWLVPLIAAAIVALLLSGATRHFEPSPPGFTLDVVVIMWCHVIFGAGFLWLLKPTRLVRGWWAVANPPKWQFGTIHLLTLLTSAAVISFLVKQADQVLRERNALLVLIVGGALLLIAIVVIRAQVAHGFLRLAASCGVALLLAAVSQSFSFVPVGFNLYAFYLIQAAMIWSWAEWSFPVHDSTATEDRKHLPEAGP